MAAQQVFQRMMGVIRILYGALVLSTVLLGIISFIVPGNAAAPEQSMELALGLVAVVVAVMSFVLPRMGAKANTRRIAEVLPPEPQPDGRAVSRFANPEAAARTALARAQTPFILSMALSEAVSLLGLALHMLGAPQGHTLPFFVAGTVLALVRFPTAGRLVAEFERAHGASFELSMDGVKL